MDGIRSFTIVSITKVGGATLNYTGGRFLGKSPSQVVKKVYSHAYRHCKTKCNSFVITISETTQGSLKKQYTYRVTRKKEHTIVERDGVEIEYNFTTKVKSLNI
jgi:hypothetical protein